MSKFIEKALRRRVDPERLLPVIRLLPLKKQLDSPRQSFKLLRELEPVGGVELLHTILETGRPVTRIGLLEVKQTEDRELIRCAAVLSILATASAENIALASSEHGTREREVAVWCWLNKENLAVLEQPFTPQLTLHRGEVLYTGRAIAPPIDPLQVNLHR